MPILNPMKKLQKISPRKNQRPRCVVNNTVKPHSCNSHTFFNVFCMNLFATFFKDLNQHQICC